MYEEPSFLLRTELRNPNRYLSILEALANRHTIKEDEIDIVTINERENKILLAECRWSKNKVGFSLLNDLKEKAKEVRWKNGERNEDLLLFSRSGFTKKLKEEVSDSNDIHLVTLKHMEENLY